MIDWTKDNVETAFAVTSHTSKYKLIIPKLMPTAEDVNIYVTTHNKKNRKGKGCSKKQKHSNVERFEENYENEAIPTTIIYKKNVDSEQLKIELGEKLERKRDIKPNNVNSDLAKNYEKKIFGEIHVPFNNQNECLIRMDKSLNEDIIRAGSKVLAKGKTKIPSNIDDENDGSLDLSPIHKTENSFFLKIQLK